MIYATIIATAILVTTVDATFNGLRSHKLYPSDEEEYDPFVFDPHNLHGSPYGGFARATRSRLATIPVRILGGAGYIFDERYAPLTGNVRDADGDGDVDGDGDDGDGLEDDDGNGKHESSGDEKDSNKNEDDEEDISSGIGSDDNDGDKNDEREAEEKDPTISPTSSSLSSVSPPIFTMRDGDGRPFVCRVYLEDELESSSITEGMFEFALEKGGNEKNKEDEDEKEAEENNEVEEEIEAEWEDSRDEDIDIIVSSSLPADTNVLTSDIDENYDFGSTNSQGDIYKNEAVASIAKAALLGANSGNSIKFTHRKTERYGGGLGVGEDEEYKEDEEDVSFNDFEEVDADLEKEYDDDLKKENVYFDNLLKKYVDEGYDDLNEEEENDDFNDLKKDYDDLEEDYDDLKEEEENDDYDDLKKYDDDLEEDYDEPREEEKIKQVLVEKIDKDKKVVITPDHVHKLLALLDGKCSQMHLGFWSFSWCHGDAFLQFHVDTRIQHPDDVRTNKDDDDIDNDVNDMRKALQKDLDSSSSTSGKNIDDNPNPAKVKFRFSEKTKLGAYNKRFISVKKSEKYAGESVTMSLTSSDSTAAKKEFEGVVIVSDSFNNGAYCEAAQRKRSATVTLQCCAPDDLKAVRHSFISQGTTNPNLAPDLVGVIGDLDQLIMGGEGKPTALLWNVEEGKGIVEDDGVGGMCHYNAIVCTNVLCKDTFSRIVDDHSHNDAGKDDDSKEDGDNKDGENIENSKNNESSKNNKSSKNRESSIADTISKMKPSQSPLLSKTATPRFFAKDASIRVMLKEILTIEGSGGGTVRNNNGYDCLEMKIGWWTYAYCHGERILQFHRVTSIDPLTQKVNLSVNQQYILGKYDIDGAEGFTKDQELSKIVSPGSENLIGTDHSIGGSGSIKKDATDGHISDQERRQKRELRRYLFGTRSSETSGRGNGAYYEIEYRDGDVCGEDQSEDLDDSSPTKGVKRSSTVRFFCGSTMNLAKVVEDRTCHYTLDVTIPELCHHQYFKVAKVKTQVVKCLPMAG